MASWNPALRPNAAGPADAADAPIPTKNDQTSQPHSQSPLEDQASPNADMADLGDLAVHTSASASTLPQNPLEHDISAPADAISPRPIDLNPATAPPAPSANFAKHASCISFARTVSHEVNWLDEEDGDWDVGTSDPDSFSKHIPKHDGTSSFPPVPLQPVSEALESDTLERSLPDSQAEEITNNVEHETGLLGPATFGSSGTEQVSPSQDVSSTEPHFEEGVPPIARLLCQPSLRDPFFEKGGDGVNFVGQTNCSTEKPSFDSKSFEFVERNSAIQVMGNMGSPRGSDGARNQDHFDANIAELLEDNKKPQDDLATKWAMEFADDEDFVLDSSKGADPTSFFGGDDEGFLEEDDLGTSPSLSAAVTEAAFAAKNTGSRYAPANLNLKPSTSVSTLQQSSPSWHPQIPPTYSKQAAGQSPVPGAYNAPPPASEPSKAESFADKAKEGYQSPYDLPMDVFRPRKRASMTQLSRTTSSSPPVSLPPTPSSSSFGEPGPGRPSPGQSQPVLSAGSKPTVQAKGSFFEELPMTSRSRPTSRHSLPSPSQRSPYGPLLEPDHGLARAPPQPLPVGAPLESSFVLSQRSSHPKGSSAPPMPNLVAAPRSGPYAPVQSPSQPDVPPSASSSSRYSPTTVQGPPVGGGPIATSNRYSPVPLGGSKPYVAGYMHSSASMLPHQPRTSSPLAHVETSTDKPRVSSAPLNGDGAPPLRRNSSAHQHSVTRVPSLPPTREVDEETDLVPLRAYPATPSLSSNSSPTEGRHPASHSPSRQTPPPSAASRAFSPSKRGHYAPFSPSKQDRDFAPPPRSQTQSPGSLHGNRPAARVSDPIPRPSSAHVPVSPSNTCGQAPTATQPQVAQSISSSPSTSQGLSQKYDLIPPVDGRENDPLQRWKGCPLFSWGVGGTLVMSFPKPVPRYGGVNSSRPSMVMSPGEVKFGSIKEVKLLEDRLATFPGPLKGKSKKKETITWLNSLIEALEKELSHPPFEAHHGHYLKREVERVLLWKILRVFVEHDGILEGSPLVEKVVREVLNPGFDIKNSEPSAICNSGSNMMSLQESALTRMQSDAVDSSTVEKIRSALLRGDRETAVWTAVDKRLWGHAMLIARNMPPELFVKVAQEFIRKEVNYPAHNNQSLAALYGVFAGNFDECVDELVPIHARAGLKLVATEGTSGPARNEIEGLDKWRETLGLILSNRSPGDARALTSLGSLLSGYGRAEAAHTCFLFARQAAVFGGLDDPTSNFVLLGADHLRQAQHFSNENETLLLSEVYEYGLSLAGGSNAGVSAPHLAAYKLQHAMTLAEHGHRDKALQYCEALASSISSQTRRSPYHHPALESAVDDLMKRLKQAPKEESNSWIPKPSMTKVSDSLFKKFNNFVAGDDNDESSSRSPVDVAGSGPFARVAGGTPTISRSPSVTNLDPYAGSAPQTLQAPLPVGQAASVPPTRTASRYTPAPSAAPVGAPTSYPPSGGYAPAPKPPLERRSSECSRSANELSPCAPSEPIGSPSFGRAPNEASPTLELHSSPSYQPFSTQNSPPAPSLSRHPHEPTETAAKGEPLDKADSPVGLSSKIGGLPSPCPGAQPDSGNGNLDEPKEEDESIGWYQAPSHGYEPPSYHPYQSEQSNDDEDEKPKLKKTILDEDEDDVHAVKAQPHAKTKAEKDKENEELFRKAAEEDGGIASNFPSYDCVIHTDFHKKRNEPGPKRLREQRADSSPVGSEAAGRRTGRLLLKPSWVKLTNLFSILI